MAQVQLKEDSRRRQRLESELAALQASHAAAHEDAEGAAAAATAQAAQAAATAERLKAELEESRDAVKVRSSESASCSSLKMLLETAEAGLTIV